LTPGSSSAPSGFDEPIRRATEAEPEVRVLPACRWGRAHISAVPGRPRSMNEAVRPFPSNLDPTSTDPRRPAAQPEAAWPAGRPPPEAGRHDAALLAVRFRRATPVRPPILARHRTVCSTRAARPGARCHAVLFSTSSGGWGSLPYGRDGRRRARLGRGPPGGRTVVVAPAPAARGTRSDCKMSPEITSTGSTWLSVWFGAMLPVTRWPHAGLVPHVMDRDACSLPL
jgi:hypothetical protein